MKKLIVVFTIMLSVHDFANSQDKKVKPKIFVLTGADDVNYYYAVDLSNLGNEYRRMLFMDLIYKDSVIVNTGRDTVNHKAFFLSKKFHTEQKAAASFENIFKEIDRSEKVHTAKDKENWIKYNQKIK